MSTELDWLRERMEAAIGDLPGVSRKRMFGCDAYFHNDKIFSLVWKEERIGVKLPDETSFAELSKVKGVEPWSPGGKMTMGAWLLVPAAWNEDEDKLAPWVARAHGQAGTGTTKKTTKKATKKKPAAKRPVAKKKPAKKKAR